MQTYDYIIPTLSLPPPVLKEVGKRYFAISVRNSCDCVHCVARANAAAKERADKNKKSIFELITEKTPGYGKDNISGSATNWS